VSSGTDHDDRTPAEGRRGGCGGGPGGARVRRGDQGAAPASVHGTPRDPGVYRRNLADRERRKSDPGSFDHLDRILSEQHYWLSFWRWQRGDQLPAVLRGQRTDQPPGRGPPGLRRLPRAGPPAGPEGKVTGLRVDHVDGLYDPHGYLSAHSAADGSEDENPSGILRPGRKDPREGRGASARVADPWNDGIRLHDALNGVFVSAGASRPWTRSTRGTPAPRGFPGDGVPEQETDDGHLVRG